MAAEAPATEPECWGREASAWELDVRRAQPGLVPGTGSAWCCERPEAGADVGDEFGSDLHERETEEVVAVVAAAGIAAAPDVIGGAVFGERAWVGEEQCGAVGLERELAAQSAQHDQVLTCSQSGRSVVWRPACLAPAAVPRARMRSNCWRLVALQA